MKKLFILDAYALIFRAYYAFINAPRINSKGRNTSAILGFVNTLEEIIRKERPDCMAVAFDPAGPTFRHEAYPAYKAQRDATPEDIHLSVPDIKRILQAYGIPQLEVAGFEADDVIGTVAHQAAAAGYDTYMMTPDKDYAQLVAPHITMCRPGRSGGAFEMLGPAEVCEKYGVARPEQVIDLLGLMGDAADNIPGCPGVGPKTAARLIAEFDSIDGLLAHTAQLKGALRQKVEDNAEQIRFSRYLATIRTDVPLTPDFEAMRLGRPDAEQLRAIFDELEFRTLLERVLKNHGLVQSAPTVMPDLFSTAPADGGQEEKQTSLSTLADVPHNYHLIETESDASSLCEKLLTTEVFSLDTETSSLDVMAGRLVGLSFATAPGEAYYVALPAEREEALKMLQLLKPAYEAPHILKVGQNLKFDLNMLAQYGITLSGPLYDTMLAHYVLQPELRHNMDYLAETYLNYRTIHIDALIGPKGRKQKSMADLPPADIRDYACEDADVTLRLYHALRPEVEKAGAARLLHDIEMPLMPVLAHMERNGVRIDTDALADTGRHFTARLKELETEIFSLSGHPFVLTSPRKVGEVLFDELHITDKPKKTKTGQYVTSEEVLEGLRQHHPIIGKILAHRALKKLMGTYVDALPKLIHPATGRIHTSFNQAVTATGRLSSSNPNLQNIPVRGDDGREIRKAFVPDPGCLFFSADYSQIELRIMAHLSVDEALIDAFRRGDDIHAATAARVFHKPISEVTRDERRKAKTANFGIIYGISAFGLAERMEVSRTEARQLIDSYFQTYPGVRRYMDESIERARNLGYIETLLGRRRYLPDIHSRNAVVRGYAERNAINAPIQGSAADIIKLAMIAIDRRFAAEGLRSKMILQVHDELNFSVVPEEREQVERIVVEAMEGACALRVPLKADCGWGANWLEAH